MAVIFEKDFGVNDLLTTGNPWVIKFTSDNVEAPIRATVQYLTETFSIDPDPNGKFRFDFSESVNRKLNTTNYNDELTPDLSGGVFVYNEPSYYLDLSVTITVEFEVAADETSSKDYRFKKAVYDSLEYELGRQPLDLDFDILLPKTNEIAYARTTSGQPFDVSIYSQEDNASVFTQNVTTGEDNTIALTKGVNRVFFNDGNSNLVPDIDLQDGWNIIRFFPISGNLTIFYQVNIFQESEPCYTVLKWFNHEGGWSYYPFLHSVEDFTGNTLDYLENDYDSFDESIPMLSSTGAEVMQELTHTAIKIPTNEAKAFRSLISSPKVYQLYTKADDTPHWKERVFKQGQLRLKQTGKNVFDFQINTFEKQDSYKL